MFLGIRMVKLLLIVAVAGFSLIFPPNLGLSPASPGGQGDGAPIHIGGDDQNLGDGGTDGSDPDEFGIYASDGRLQGGLSGVAIVRPDDQHPEAELSDFWIAVLRYLWMIRH